MTRSTNQVASTTGGTGILATADADSREPSSEHRHAADSYRFEHFNFRLMLQDLRFSRGSLRAGDQLPDATLMTLDGKEISLRELAAHRPTVLVTGSPSCPLTAGSLPNLNRLASRFGDSVQFVLVQVREAHPGAELNQPLTQQEKRERAQLMREVMGVRWPVLVDDIDGSLHRMLDTMPNSLHIVGTDGTILYRALLAGDAAVDDTIASIVAGDRPTRAESQSMLPMLESAGFIHDTLVRAGAGAYGDVIKSAPPMAALALGTRLLPFVPKGTRGYALMTLLTAGAAAVAWIL